jgi:PAS domain-containing protein
LGISCPFFFTQRCRKGSQSLLGRLSFFLEGRSRSFQKGLLSPRAAFPQVSLVLFFGRACSADDPEKRRYWDTRARAKGLSRGFVDPMQPMQGVGVGQFVPAGAGMLSQTPPGEPPDALFGDAAVMNGGDAVSDDQQEEDTDTPKKKRQQVSRACMQCRRQHAACDNKRPCGRCIRRKIADECVDAPRRARAKRGTGGGGKVKKQPESTGVVGATFDDVSTPNMVVDPAEVAALLNQSDFPASQTPIDSEGLRLLLEEQQAAMQQQQQLLDQHQQQLLLDQQQQHHQQLPQQQSAEPNRYASLEIAPSENWGGYYETIFKGHEHGDVSASEFDPAVRLPEVETVSVPGVVGGMHHANGDLPPEGAVQYFWDQIELLKAENAELGRQLAEVSTDVQHVVLSDDGNMNANLNVVSDQMPSSSGQANQLSAAVNISGKALAATTRHISDNLGWYDLGDQSLDNIPVSVWRSSSAACQNTLIECNDAFVELLGLPVEVLRTGFTCQQMMTKACRDAEESGIPLCQQHWLRRTQINSVQGLKDVFMSITPIASPTSDDLFFVIHFLPAD